MRAYFGPSNVIELDKDERYCEAPAYSAELVGKVLDDAPDMRGFACHKFVPTIHRCDAFRAVPVVFLRHPLLRLASVYRYERISEIHQQTPSGKLAMKLDLSDWLDAYADTYNGQNYQTCVLSIQEDGQWSPYTNDHPSHIGDLKVAMERLDEIKDLIGIGIVEKFAATAAYIEERINRFLPGFSLSMFCENQTQETRTPSEELAKLEASVSTSTLKKVVESNISDYALYERYL